MTPIHNILFGFACASLFVSAQAHAEATVIFLQGDVRDDGVPVTQGRRVLPGTTLTTGRGAQVFLQFSDRQKIVLDQESAFKVADFHYEADEPQRDRATFDLLRGAARFISGVIGARTPRVVALRTPQATFSVRGTDFMVALPNWAYLKVLKGAVSVTNLGGTITFGENTAAIVTSDSAIAKPVFVRNLPPVASRPFSNLAVPPLEAAVTQAAASNPAPTEAAVAQVAASGATGAETRAVPAPGIDGRAAIKIGIYAALISAALSGSSGNSGSSATTHH